MTALLLQLGVTLLVLFLAGRLAYQIRFSIVPLYILAGIFLGTYVHHSELVDFLSLLGIIFLLFYMGLDFSLTAFLSQWRSLVVSGSIDLIINFGLGLLIGGLLGWTLIETLFLAGILYMTSSAVVAKSLIELKRVANPETETILGIMVFEDLVIALYLAVLSGVALSGRMEALPITLAVFKRRFSHGNRSGTPTTPGPQVFRIGLSGSSADFGNDGAPGSFVRAQGIARFSCFAGFSSRPSGTIRPAAQRRSSDAVQGNR